MNGEVGIVRYRFSLSVRFGMSLIYVSNVEIGIGNKNVNPYNTTVL